MYVCSKCGNANVWISENDKDLGQSNPNYEETFGFYVTEKPIWEISNFIKTRRGFCHDCDKDIKIDWDSETEFEEMICPKQGCHFFVKKEERDKVEICSDCHWSLKD